jgi:hypothetical protein
MGWVLSAFIFPAPQPYGIEIVQPTWKPTVASEQPAWEPAIMPAAPASPSIETIEPVEVHSPANAIKSGRAVVKSNRLETQPPMQEHSRARAHAKSARSPGVEPSKPAARGVPHRARNYSDLRRYMLND